MVDLRGSIGGEGKQCYTRIASPLVAYETTSLPWV